MRLLVKRLMEMWMMYKAWRGQRLENTLEERILRARLYNLNASLRKRGKR